MGFQIGGSSTDVILLVMNSRGVDKLLSSKFTVGADAAVAAGPLGRSDDVLEEIYAIRSRRGQHHPLVAQMLAAVQG